MASFACAAKVGTTGPSIEMPLETMRRSLRERIADKKNGDFLREDALLAIVLLTDEEDCSRGDDKFTVASPADVCTKTESPESYAGFLDTLKGRGRWATAVVAGPGPGSCTSSFGEAQEAKRLQSFVRAAGANGKFSSICAGDLATSLNDALGTFSAACRTCRRAEPRSIAAVVHRRLRSRPCAGTMARCGPRDRHAAGLLSERRVRQRRRAGAASDEVRRAAKAGARDDTRDAEGDAVRDGGVAEHTDGEAGGLLTYGSIAVGGSATYALHGGKL